MPFPQPDTLADIGALVAAMPGPDGVSASAAAEREGRLTKPPGALGRLERLAQWLATWQGRQPPRVARALVVVFAGSHGVTGQGVSAYPATVTAQMVRNFEAGGAAINQICRAVGAELRVVDLAETPTRDFTQGPAMDEAACAAAVAAGMAAVEDGIDLLAVGEMGIGNTAAAAAICHALFGGEAADWTGPGTGVAGAALARKVAAVAEGVAVNRTALGDPLQVLRCLGGREIAAMTGAILAARLGRVPVLLDGYVTGAAASVLHALDPGALDHCVAAHCSAEPAHRRLLEKLGQAPLLDLGMRLGEATGAALAIALVRAAAECHTGMATFAEAGVADKDE